MVCVGSTLVCVESTSVCVEALLVSVGQEMEEGAYKFLLAPLFWRGVGVRSIGKSKQL